MTKLTTQSRSLTKLAPMIRKELKAGFQAGERHWQKAGRLLNEARQHFTNQGKPISGKGPTWYEWVDNEFEHPWTREKLGRSTVHRWMAAVRNGASRSRDANKSLTAHVDKRTKGHDDYKPQLDWKSGVRNVQQKINPDRLAQRWKDEQQEIKERAALARKIVDAGYRALAAVVHPDKKGGSKEAMAKLAKTRKWIEELIRSQS